MLRQTYLRIALIIGFLGVGALLLLRPAGPAAENASRRDALGALAPGGAPGVPIGVDPDSLGRLTTLPPVRPAVRDMADVTIDTTYPDSMYNRWLRGEVDLDEADGIISAAELVALKEAAALLPADPVLQQAYENAAPNAPTPGAGFASMDYTDGGGSVPPDPEMAVGPNHLIATVNVAVAMYNKDGSVAMAPTAAGNLFSNAPCTSGLYDPNVIYDEEAGRWFLAYDQGAQTTTGGYCVLASLTDDPTGLWYEYFFQLNSAGGWMDYPHAGVGDNFIFMGGNIFGISGGFVEGRIYAFNKADLYAGNPVSVIQQGLGSGIDTPQPLNLHGFSTGTWPSFGDTHYFLGEPFDGSNYTLLQWDTSTLTNLGNINLGAGAAPPDAVQSGSAALLNTNDFRPQDFEYRNGYGWTSMAIGCNPGSGTVSCVRWAQIDLNAAALGPAGSGVLGSNGDYRYFPDLAVNHCDDMAMGYTRSNSSSFPSVYVTGRLGTDPAGTLQAESLVKAGEIAYTAFDGSPHRWGDYTGMTIDPDGQTFWYLGQYSGITGNANGRWATWISSFSYPSCSIGPDVVLTAAPTDLLACTTDTVLYDVDVIGAGGFVDPVTLSAAGLPAGATAGFSSNPVQPTGSSQLTVGNLAGAVPGSYALTVQGVGGTPAITRTVGVSLTLYDAQPAAVVLQTPLDGQAGVDLVPILSWDPVSGAVSYAVEVATDAAFSNVVASAAGLTSTSFAAGGLAPTTLYYWRVTADNPCGSVQSGVRSFLTVGQTSVSYCATPALAIPDGNAAGAFDDLVVPSGSGIVDLDVSVDITHTWVGDLGVTLQNLATGTTVTLIDRPGVPALTFGCSNNDIDVTVNDEGGDTPIENQCTSPVAVTGDAPGSGSLADFDGESLTGTWRLTANDVVTPDPGTLNEWCLLATIGGTPVVADYSDLTSGYGVAWHEGSGTYRLGSAWSAGTLFATGSDDSDDDGVSASPGDWIAGQSATLDVVVTGPAGSAFLAAWFDWNGDGDFADAGEQVIAQSVTAAPGGQATVISFTVSPDFDLIQVPNLQARFRLYDVEPGLAPEVTETPAGGAAAGEVEDYIFSAGPTGIGLTDVGGANSSPVWVVALLAVALLALGSGIALGRRQR